MWWLIAVIVGGIVFTVAWDSLRDTLYRWAHRNNIHVIKKVLLGVDTLRGDARKKLRLLALPEGAQVENVVDERIVSEDELPEEIREQLRQGSSVVVDITQKILKH